jgi:hypothetical protein
MRELSDSDLDERASMAADPAAVGVRVLAALEAGRREGIARAQARAAALAVAVRRELDSDILAGHAERGRAGRISRRLAREGVTVTERGARKILERLSSRSG